MYPQLPIYTRYNIWTACRRCLRGIQGVPQNENRVNSEIHSEAVIERVLRCNCRSRLSQLRDAQGGHNRANLEMQLEIEIVWTQRCNGRLWSSEIGDAHAGRSRVNSVSKFGDAIGDLDWVNSEMHLEDVIERVWRCTRRPWSSELEVQLETEIEWTPRCTGRPWSIEFGDAIGDRAWVNSEMHWETVIERVWRCTWSSRSSELSERVCRRNWRPKLSGLRDTVRGRDQASLEMDL